MVGTAALAGVFPLAGFWSKDEILASADANGFEVFLVIGLIGAFMTAAYMTRCVYLTFFGEYRGGHAEEHGTVRTRSRPRPNTPPTSLARQQRSHTPTLTARSQSMTPTTTTRTRARTSRDPC